MPFLRRTAERAFFGHQTEVDLFSGHNSYYVHLSNNRISLEAVTPNSERKIWNL